MKVDESKSLIMIIKEAKIHELVIVTLVVLPIILGCWNFLITKLFSPTKEVNIYINIALIVIYIIGIIVMKTAETKNAKDNRAKILITNHLLSFKQRSYQFIREKFGSEFTDDYLDYLIKKYPNEFRQQAIKGKGKGIALDIEEKE